MSDWRHDPATDAQKKRLKEEGFKHSSSITKGEASDLIGSTTSPGEREKAILKFFKAQGISKMSETDARKKIESILSDPANTQRWENRPADKEQKDVYHFFNLKVPPKLSRPDAARFIDELLKDEEKAKAWDKHEEEAADREAWFEDNFEMFNDIREDYDCKKITFKLFQQVVESLQASGMTLEQIEENEDAFFEKALEINPNLQRAPSGRSSSTTEYRDNGKSGISLRGIVILAIIILVVWAII